MTESAIVVGAPSEIQREAASILDVILAPRVTRRSTSASWSAYSRFKSGFSPTNGARATWLLSRGFKRDCRRSPNPAASRTATERCGTSTRRSRTWTLRFGRSAPRRGSRSASTPRAALGVSSTRARCTIETATPRSRRWFFLSTPGPGATRCRARARALATPRDICSECICTWSLATRTTMGTELIARRSPRNRPRT